MPKSEREEMLSTLASRIFSAMLEDIVMDAALQSHHEVARSRAVCRVCDTRCGSAHTPGPSNAASQIVASPSRPATPSSIDAKPVNGSAGTGTSTPTSVKADGNVYFECLNCNRQIASNRYAPHLGSCMGIGTGTRRGAARGNNAKSKHSSEAGRSASPASEVGNVSDDGRNLKGKSKSKSKRVDEAEFNLKRKRPVSPQITPNKKQKKKSSGSPVSRVKADPDKSGMLSNTHQLPSTGSKSKVPSKLRDSSTASFIEQTPTTSSSRSSSPGVASAATPTSSSFSAQSPSFAGRSAGNANRAKKVTGVGPPKRLSPPRPPPPPLQDYTVDVEGEETGSSTDTDSS